MPSIRATMLEPALDVRGRDQLQPLGQGYRHRLDRARRHRPQLRFDFTEHLFDRRFVRTGGRQRLDLRPRVLQQCDGLRVLMRLQVVPDHDVPRTYFWAPYFFDILLKGRCVRRSWDDEGGHHARGPQARDQGHALPGARGRGLDPFSYRRAALVLQQHFGPCQRGTDQLQ